MTSGDITDDELKGFLRRSVSNFGEEDEDFQLLFSKKSRPRRQTKYNFYKGGIEGEETDGVLKGFLRNNVESVLSGNFIDDFDVDNPDAHVKIDLKEIEHWEQYEAGITKIRLQELEDLKLIKSSLNNFVLVHNFDGITVGQIRRLYPSQVLVDSEKYILPFNNNVFNDVKQEDRVEIDKNADLIFLIKEDTKICLTKNQTSFNEIFDMDEQYKEEAINVLTTSNVMDCCAEPSIVKETVENDRNLQNMLRNDVTKKGFSEITHDELICIKRELCKRELGDVLSFELDSNNKVVLSSNTKESVRDLIKAVGYHYNFSIVGENIVEGKPKRLIPK